MEDPDDQEMVSLETMDFTNWIYIKENNKPLSFGIFYQLDLDEIKYT